MSNRILRVNELILREMSAILRKHYKEESVCITITGIKVTEDLLEGRVYVAIMGDDDVIEKKLRWLRKNAQEIRFELGRLIVLKHMPKFTFEVDTTTARGNRILGILDEIDAKDKRVADQAKKEKDTAK